MRAGGYIRVSHIGGRDRDRFLSPTLQRERIAGWCDTNGHELAVVREDLDVSGGRKDRSNLLDLVEMVENGRLQVIVVASLDRFGRSLADAITLLDRIDQADGQFVSVKDGFDTRTPYGRLALNILLSIAQFELERHRAQSYEHRVKLVDQGRHTGSLPPLGYTRGTEGRLQPDDRAGLIRELFARRATGESPTALARWLEDQGVTTGRGGQPTRRYVVDVIRNRAYLGEVRFGDTVNDEAHPALVDRVTFERANAAAGPKPAAGTTGLLGGLVRCHACRYTMGAAKAPYRNGTWKRAYRCRPDKTTGRCPRPAFVVDEHLAPIVETMFFRQLGDMRARAAGKTDQVDDLRTARDRARHALTVYRDDPQVIGALGPADYAEGLRVRRAALDEAERMLAAELASRPDGLPDVADLRLAWPEMDHATKRLMLRAVFDVVVVSAPKVHRSHSEPLANRVGFIPAGSGPADLPRQGRSPDGLVAFPPLDSPDGPWVPIGKPPLEDRRDG